MPDVVLSCPPWREHHCRSGRAACIVERSLCPKRQRNAAANHRRGASAEASAGVRPPRNSARSARVTRSPRTPPSPQQVASEQSAGAPGALTVLTAQQALAEIDRLRAAWRSCRPGVQELDTVQHDQGCSGLRARRVRPAQMGRRHPSFDSRSGLSRNFHLRGVQLYMDGIPINTADGYGDFQEIDPSAYKYVEVFKAATRFSLAPIRWGVRSTS